MKKKVLVDIDVVTVAKWDKGKNADSGRSLISRIEKGEFHMITPYIVLDLVNKWKNEPLKKQITEFYEIYSSEILALKEIVDRAGNENKDYDGMINGLVEIGVKEEDAVLVFVSSIYKSDFLVTYNRIHLRNKEKEINLLLKKNKMKVIRIAVPNDV